LVASVCLRVDLVAKRGKHCAGENSTPLRRHSSRAGPADKFKDGGELIGTKSDASDVDRSPKGSLPG
jgi:hypothetical protein